MGKEGNTKKKIFEIIKRKSSTLTDISRELELAPSTVSQHLQEMTASGMISQVEGNRKWKYYQANSAPNISANMNQTSSPFRKVGVPITIAFVAFAVLAVILLSNKVSTASAQQVYLPSGANVPAGSTIFTISDAPTSYNVSALYITVQGMKIHSINGTWYTIPLQRTTFDLIKLDNISQRLSAVELNNGIYNQIVLNVSNVSAVVNGTNESVILPTGKLVVVGRFNLSKGSTNWINVDFDLKDSLFMTTNNILVMIPVLRVTHVNDTGLQLNQSDIIIAKLPGRIKSDYRFGMDKDGNMISNYTAQGNMTMMQRNGHTLNIWGEGPRFQVRGYSGFLLIHCNSTYAPNSVNTENAIWANNSIQTTHKGGFWNIGLPHFGR